MMDFDDIDFDSEQMMSSNNCCNGPQHCENRLFDSSKSDCQACLDDCERAITK
jgi:hypothetical protein